MCYLDRVELVFNRGCDYNNNTQSTGYTALMFACKKGHLDTVLVLMEHGVNLEITNMVSNNWPFNIHNL